MTYHCKRCNHTWESRLDKKPVTCPKCKSYRYETEARKPEKGGSTTDKGESKEVEK